MEVFHPNPVIGLLGGIGSGKSTVARCFAHLGCVVVDADALARDALDTSPVRQELVKWWGPQVLGPDGHVDRAAVSRQVFDRPEALKCLEDLIHPRVLAERARQIARWRHERQIQAIVDDTPLLMEKNLQGDCDVLVFVDAPETLRLERVQAARGWDAAELTRRQKNQLPLDKKLEAADYCVDNSRDEVHCQQQVRRILSQIIREARAREES